VDCSQVAGSGATKGDLSVGGFVDDDRGKGVDVSGSPIVTEIGTAIGVVCTAAARWEDGPNPREIPVLPKPFKPAELSSGSLKLYMGCPLGESVDSPDVQH